MPRTFKTIRFLIIFLLMNAICGFWAPFSVISYAAQIQNVQNNTEWLPVVNAKQGPEENARLLAATDAGLPDLAAIGYNSAADEVMEGEPFWIILGVGNVGAASAGPSKAKLYLSTDNDFDVTDDYYVGEADVGSVEPEAYEVVQWVFTMPAIQSKNHSFWVVFVVDSDNAVEESSESNTFKGTSPLNIICTYSLSSTGATLAASGGSGSINVTTAGGCGWEAASDSDWVTLTSSDCGSGDGTVEYWVSSNADANTRTGVITIAGETFTITQAGGSTCNCGISPAGDTYTSPGGSGSIDVTVPDDCYWHAAADSDWVMISSGGSGHGNGTVAYSVLPNYSESSRTATVTIAEKAFTVKQTGGSVQTNEYVFERMWPALQQPWYFNMPFGIATDPQGNIFVVDTDNYQIQKFTSSGEFMTKWGSKGTGDGLFAFAFGIATDGSGNVYVTDSNSHSIQKFTSAGAFITRWGSKGTEDGQLNAPRGIAIDHEGNVYVADSANNRIQKFTASGEFMTQWESIGAPCGIAVDHAGDVYVVSISNERLQKFTSSGELIAEWESGTSKYAYAVAIDASGNVYVAQSLLYSYRIKKFSPSGALLAHWESDGSEDGGISAAYGLAVDSGGYVYVADSAYDRILKFTSSLDLLTQWGSLGVRDGEFDNPQGIAMDGAGNVYVVEGLGLIFSGNDRIQKFTSSGTFITKWGGRGGGDGQFRDACGIVMDGEGIAYVADTDNNRIQKFTSTGEFIAEWGAKGSGDGQFNSPYKIAINPAGYVYVLDKSNHRIQKFTSSGDFITKWGNKGSEDGGFDYPEGIAVDTAGNVYVADTNNHRIQKFTSSGEFITKWGSKGTGDGEFQYPNGMTTDSEENVYVADRNNHRIQKFSPDGVFIKTIGASGSGPGFMNAPTDLAVTSTGKIYVADSYNNRIQVFRKVTTGNNNKAIILAGGGPFPGNNLWDSTQMCANFAYRTLTYQGFTKATIHYLTSDTDLDLDRNGLPDDVDGDATNSNLQQAITEWAKDADSVLLYLTDHGGNGTFGMSGNETLTVSDLDTWLDQLQESISGKVTVIYDACESGSFLSSLSPPSGKERVVITSTSAAEPAVFMNQGSMSFSNYFWSHIFNGASLKDALDLAHEAIGISLGDQTPLLDANGNGVGNEDEDYALIENTHVGNATVISGDAPVISSVSPAQTVTDTSSATLYAGPVTDSDGISRVWAVIRSPDYNQGSPDNPVTSLPSIELMPTGEDGYEGTYNGFHTPGTYQIAIYAMDSLLNTCVPKLTTVSVDNPLRRRAIIVAGGPESDPLWPAIENNAGAAYKALTFQGYTDDDIYFMSPIVFSSGYDALATVSNLQFAINKFKTDTYDVVLYMVGKGGYQIFQMDTGEIVQGAQLDSWLDALQESIPGKVTVICDACGSGSLVPLLTSVPGKERMFIASTSDAESAYFLSGGDISFSKFFWNQVANGANVKNAFIQSKDAIAPSCKRQTPLFDVDGNGIINDVDRKKKIDYTIGMGIMLAGDNPIVNSISPAQSLSGGTSAGIRAEQVTTTGTIKRVWAVITPPGYGPGLCETPLEYLPTLELTDPDDDGLYEGTYDGFSTSGAYGVAVYAMDQNGNISMPVETSVIQENGYEIGLPIVSTEAADGLTHNAARLNATINANGANTTWTFQYGTDTSYGMTTAEKTIFGATATSVSVPIANLKTGIEYCFRIVGTNSTGTSYGDKRTFKTAFASVLFVSGDDPSCGGNNPCYTTLQTAVDAAVDGTLIKVAGGTTYEEAMELREAKFLTLSGKWNNGFTDQTGNTTIIKAPKAAKGSLTLQNVNIRP